MPVEQHPIGTFPPSEATPNPEIRKMDLDQLQELVEWPSKMQEFVEERDHPTPPEPASTSEPVELPPVETPPAPEPAPEAASAAEPVKPAEPQPEDVERELLKAQLEALEAHSKKLEAKVTGREAGERGYIKQLQERIRRLESGEAPEQPPESQYRPESATEIAPAQPRDGFRTWAVQKASQEAVQAFSNSHSDVKELESEMMNHLQQTGFDARSIIQLDDPIAAGREMTRVLEETYWHLKEARTRARIEELQTRKADQVRGLEEAKRRAAPSASGSPPVPAPPRKGLKDLSVAELEAKMRALSGR